MNSASGIVRVTIAAAAAAAVLHPLNVQYNDGSGRTRTKYISNTSATNSITPTLHRHNIQSHCLNNGLTGMHQWNPYSRVDRCCMAHIDPLSLSL